jgi:hypothetical protein
MMIYFNFIKDTESEFISNLLESVKKKKLMSFLKLFTEINKNYN